MSSAPPRLVALSPGTLERGGRTEFLAALGAALDAGLPGLLLREPGLTDRALLALGAELGALRARRPFWFALHDRAHLVAALGAEALHLSFRSLAPREARRALAPEVALGLSTHAADARAGWRGVDYLFHGPLHATPSKAARLAPIGFDGLAAAVAEAPAPLLALGGVRPEDVRRLRALGAHGVAVLSGILGAPDPARAAAAYLEELA
jgi:thiamine-phosphate pyrophosphorylase